MTAIKKPNARIHMGRIPANVAKDLLVMVKQIVQKLVMKIASMVLALGNQIINVIVISVGQVLIVQLIVVVITIRHVKVVLEFVIIVKIILKGYIVRDVDQEAMVMQQMVMVVRDVIAMSMVMKHLEFVIQRQVNAFAKITPKDYIVRCVTKIIMVIQKMVVNVIFNVNHEVY